MEKRKFTQFGTFSVAVMLPIFVFVLVMMFTAGLNDPIQAAIFGVVALTFLICLLVFYKLTIYVDDEFVGFKLGAGFVKKKYPISDIKSCRPVNNSLIYGIGIRKIPNGWLYNVSGLGAIELTFRNKKSVVRIGTNNPEKVAESINKLIATEKYEYTGEFSERNNYWLSVAIISIVVFLPAILIISGNREPTVKTAGEDFTIQGMYGVTIKYSEILQLDTVNVLPGIKRRTNGYEFGKNLKGNFTLYDGTKIKLFITSDITPYIHIRTSNLILFLNLHNSEKTVNLFKQMVAAQPTNK
jgi:hypothetical protein